MPLTKARIMHLRRLQEKKYRTESGLYVVEGPKVLEELISAGHEFREILATSEWACPAALERLATRVSSQEMARISHYSTPSPVLAVGRIPPATVLGPDELEHGYTLALDAVQDPGNVGTLLRVADWFGFDRVLLSTECADLFSQKVINASMGSFARMRSIRGSLVELLAHVKVPVLGCDLGGETVYGIAPPASAVVVIGSEGQGLSPAVRARLTQRITIPRRGAAESLNAAVAGGIICAMLRRDKARVQ